MIKCINYIWQPCINTVGKSQSFLYIKSTPIKMQLFKTFTAVLVLLASMTSVVLSKPLVTSQALQERSPPTSADIDSILTAHNDFRAKHDAPPLEWSQELADFAYGWASKCSIAHSDVGWIDECAVHDQLKVSIYRQTMVKISLAVPKIGHKVSRPGIVKCLVTITPNLDSLPQQATLLRLSGRIQRL